MTERMTEGWRYDGTWVKMVYAYVFNSTTTWKNSENDVIIFLINKDYLSIEDWEIEE